MSDHTPSDPPERPERVALSWSGGKDSALALQALRDDPRREVVALLTTIADPFGRVSHHGVREELLDAQARACGLPVVKIRLDATTAGTCPNPHYEARVEAALATLRGDGVLTVAHGDLFLEDLRRYREENLARAGMRGAFPLWGRDTRDLVRDFVARGFRAKLCCVTDALGEAFLGRDLDESLLRDLPPGVDPAGENGEYHSFVYAGPVFDEPLAVTTGEVVRQEGRSFIELRPA